ncbi:hypothetical protein [Nocardia sp. NPDC050406]|uniref:hypothetical protein n=1 Tax=Nocardia sp. NPDC050406 TaxID=3364318 RepID=UPI0037B10770
MRVRYLVALPVAVMAMVPVIGVVGAGSAQAAPRPFTCTAETWGGDALPSVTVEARTLKQAVGQAKTEWRGKAKFETIECTAS